MIAKICLTAVVVVVVCAILDMNTGDELPIAARKTMETVGGVAILVVICCAIAAIWVYL